MDVQRSVQHRAHWRRQTSLCLVAAGLMGLFLPGSDLDPVACLAITVAGVAVFLPREYASVHFQPHRQRVSVAYRGRHASLPTRDAARLVFVCSEGDDEIHLEYADRSRRALWEGRRIEGIAEAVSELAGLEVDVEVA